MNTDTEERPELEGVPTRVHWEDVKTWIESIGIPVKDLYSLSVHPGCINIEVYARNAKGSRYMGERNEVAMHKIAIEIDRGDRAHWAGDPLVTGA